MERVIYNRISDSEGDDGEWGLSVSDSEQRDQRSLSSSDPGMVPGNGFLQRGSVAKVLDRVRNRKNRGDR